MDPCLPEEKFLQAVQQNKRETWQYVLSALKPDVGECLLHAIRQRSTEAVRDVLQYRPSMNVEDSQGQRPIHLAAMYGPVQIIRLLYSAGSTMNGSNREGWPPLHIACLHGVCHSIIYELVNCGANVNAARSDDKLTPLHLAVQVGVESNIIELLACGANPNIRSSQEHGQMTPLAIAIMSESLSILEVLLQNLSRRNVVEYKGVDDKYPLHLAVEKENVEMCQLLLKYLMSMKLASDCHGMGGDEFRAKLNLLENEEQVKEQMMLNLVDGSGRTALHLAIIQNKRAMVEMLLDAGCDTDHFYYQNMLPLELATRCVQPLDYHPIPPEDLFENRQGLIGSMKWDDSIVQLLVDRSINLHTITNNGDRPIHLVLFSGLYDVAWKIVTHMPDQIDHANIFGETPLHIACKAKPQDHHSQLELVQKLLEMGLDVNARTHSGTCPISFAVQDGNLELVTLILSCSPDLTLRTNDIYTPVHFAARGHNRAVMEALLDARPEAVIVEEGRLSPLYEATLNDLDLVCCLLERGADPNHKNPRNGDTPLHGAANMFMLVPDGRPNVTMIKTLLDSGADLAMRTGTEANPSNLTPLQSMIQSLLCSTMVVGGFEKATTYGLDALKILVEAGSKLEPWTRGAAGVLRHLPMRSLAFCGLLSCAYYLANVGWPLHTEIYASKSEDGQPTSHDLNWVTLPGNSSDQDNLHAFLMLRHANPFSLMELARSAIRDNLAQASMVTHGGRLRDITPLIERLPVPEVMIKFLKFQDADYSSAEYSWKKMMPSLSSPVAEEAAKAGLS